MEDQIQYWIDLADYDLDTAKAMRRTERYLYVGFMCHQAIEKILKAYYVKVLSEHPPRSHNLTLLAEKTDIIQELSDNQKNILLTLEPLNIEARYPSQKERLLKSLTPERSDRILKETEELKQWIEAKL
jgi:HEPN domain-containing protein